jgi:hypothetical protein
VFDLSALESGSAFMPYSRLIWRSLVNLCWAWLLFYGLTIGVGLALGKALELAYSRAPWLALLAAGPALATLVLIYARLLGRLAWRIEQWVATRADDDES